MWLSARSLSVQKVLRSEGASIKAGREAFSCRPFVSPATPRKLRSGRYRTWCQFRSKDACADYILPPAKSRRWRLIKARAEPAGPVYNPRGPFAEEGRGRLSCSDYT